MRKNHMTPHHRQFIFQYSASIGCTYFYKLCLFFVSLIKRPLFFFTLVSTKCCYSCNQKLSHRLSYKLNKSPKKVLHYLFQIFTPPINKGDQSRNLAKSQGYASGYLELGLLVWSLIDYIYLVHYGHHRYSSMLSRACLFLSSLPPFCQQVSLSINFFLLFFKHFSIIKNGHYNNVMTSSVRYCVVHL